MMPLGDLFVHVYVLVDDALARGTVPMPPRRDPPPAWSDAEVLTIALVRHLLARRSERAFLNDIRREWASYFPTLPAHSEFNRRVRWLWGTCEHLRQTLLRAVPADSWQQIDTTALPVKHPSRVRGPDSWHGPDGLHQISEPVRQAQPQPPPAVGHRRCQARHPVPGPLNHAAPGLRQQHLDRLVHPGGASPHAEVRHAPVGVDQVRGVSEARVDLADGILDVVHQHRPGEALVRLIAPRIVQLLLEGPVGPDTGAGRSGSCA